MVKTDVQIMPFKDGEFQFAVRGAADNSGFMLLQRVFVLLLASSDEYRNNPTGTLLLGFLEGGNYPEPGIMDSILALCCADVMNQLSPEDRARISSLTGTFYDGKIYCTLKMNDGTTLTGGIDV